MAAVAFIGSLSLGSSIHVIVSLSPRIQLWVQPALYLSRCHLVLEYKSWSRHIYTSPTIRKVNSGGQSNKLVKWVGQSNKVVKQADQSRWSNRSSLTTLIDQLVWPPCLIDHCVWLTSMFEWPPLLIYLLLADRYVVLLSPLFFKFLLLLLLLLLLLFQIGEKWERFRESESTIMTEQSRDTDKRFINLLYKWNCKFLLHNI